MAQDNIPLSLADLKAMNKDKVDQQTEGAFTDISLKDVGTFVAEMTPIIGDAMAAKEVYDELQKDDPNYYLAGALGGAALVGLIPGVGDAAAGLMRRGAKAAFNTAKRIEVNPNALGSMGGNVSLKPKVSQDVLDAEALLDDPEKLRLWQENASLPESKRQANPEKSKQAAEDLFQGNITSKESRSIIKDELPNTLFTKETMPNMPTVTEVVGSLGKKSGKNGILGVKGFDLEAGQVVSSRLDIPAYNNYDKWVVSIHDGAKDAGSVVGYGQAIRLKNIRFGSKAKDALDIAKGKRANLTTGEEKPMGKATIARIFGEYIPEDPYKLQALASKLLDDPDWVQVGMNPYKGSAFYDKVTGFPVMEAKEVIQVGPLVLARGVKKPTISQLKELAVRTKDGKIRMFNEGGIAMNDQTEMAFADGGVPIDPVSGNEVPPGSLPEEVRDDIKVGVSEGEYIVPADVLRYYGMKFFEDLRAEAKVALGGMEQDGRMGGEPMGGEPMMEASMEEEDDLPFSTEELQSTDDVEMNKGGYMRGYAEAGLVTDPAAVAAENPDTQIQMDSMFGNMGSVNTGIEYLIYYGPNGEEITIQTFNGQPMSPIPPGYTRAPTAVAPITPVVTAPVTGNAVAQAQAPAPSIATDKNDNDKPDPVKPETEAERMSRYQKRYGVDFTADEATQNIQIQDSLNAQKVKLGLLKEVEATDDQGNKVTNLVDSITGKVFKKGSIANQTTSKLLNNALGAVLSSFVPTGLGLVVGGFKKVADKVQASATSIELLETQLKRGVINEDTFKKEVTAIRSKFNNKDEKEAGIAPDASLGDWIAGLAGWGTNKNQRGNFAEAQSFYSTNADGKPALTKTSTAPDNQAIVNTVQNTTPEQDAYKVATQNIVNKTGKQVIIGSVTPSGQVSEPGWTWVKNPGTNAITRTYTGTAAAGNPADAQVASGNTSNKER